MTDTIPTLAHAVRIGSDLSLYRERERAELIISHASGGVLVELVDRRDYERERDELKAECARLRDGLQLIACEPINAESMASNVLNGLPAYHDTILAPAASPERAEPVLEVRACGCSQAKAGRCVMGDYGALPIGTQLYAGRVPVAAPDHDDEFEVRADGKRVLKARWEYGMRRIVALLWGNRREFEIDDVVEAVSQLVPNPNKDDESVAKAVFSAYGVLAAAPERAEPTRCHADRDGDCRHPQCPQQRDGEPHTTGRHCPLDAAAEERRQEAAQRLEDALDAADDDEPEQSQPCRCGPDGCSDSTCPKKGGAA